MRDIMILALVRHGQTSYNANGLVQGRINIPMNANGRKQALALGKLLKDKEETFDRIAASPLSRALETAWIIRNELQMTSSIYVDHQFVERDFYHLDGTRIETAMPLVRIKNYKHENYEYDDMMVDRIYRAVMNLYPKFIDKKVLFVAHSHVIKALLIKADPVKYTFADLINHLDIVYFEISDDSIKVIKK